MRPMSWFPRKVGSWYTFESASVYQSSFLKKELSWLAGCPFEAKLRAASWKGKSSTACILSWVVKVEVNGLVRSKTSPNMKNSFFPWLLAYSSTSGPVVQPARHFEVLLTGVERGCVGEGLGRAAGTCQCRRSHDRRTD